MEHDSGKHEEWYSNGTLLWWTHDAIRFLHDNDIRHSRRKSASLFSLTYLLPFPSQRHRPLAIGKAAVGRGFIQQGTKVSDALVRQPLWLAVEVSDAHLTRRRDNADRSVDEVHCAATEVLAGLPLGSDQTASMLALVLNCSFLLPSFEMVKKASTP